MKIHFYLRFHTQFGQSLYITGTGKSLGEQEPAPLEYLNDQFWTYTFDWEPGMNEEINYKYILQQEDGTRILEWGNDRWLNIRFSPDKTEIRVYDTWNHAGEYENAFYTDPFQQVLLHDNHPKAKTRKPGTYSHLFKVKAPLLKKNEVLFLTGSGKTLGDWNTVHPIQLTRENGWWSVALHIPREEFPVNYKYGVYNTKTETFVAYETGDNRSLSGDDAAVFSQVHDGFARLPNSTWKGSGVAIPVFSLRSKDSFGVGEFNDLSLLVDWSVKTGLKMIQILPVNDTTATHSWQDSYPYAAISAFALHPIFLNLEAVAGKKYADLIKPLRKKQKELNEAPEVLYEEVIQIKLAALKELFQLMKDDFLHDPGYQSFFEANRYWLVPYAAFCHLRDKNGTADFSKWTVYNTYNKLSVEKYVSPRSKHYDEIAFHYFLQYHLHLQLKEAADYAHKNGVILKGDIPIGIYRYSVDAWMEPALYHMGMQAGAPPDDFAIHGQNWGFPTYNWDQMALDGFKWWYRRFIQMGHYFDAFRIDHILGFFRIWSIPLQSTQGIMGHFVPAAPVSITEFSQRNIHFDHYRYCSPFINDQVLWEHFGPNKDKFLPFLKSIGNGYYELAETVSTQRAIEDHFNTLEATEENNRIREGLLDLAANVILFEAEGSQGTAFHFRFNMEKTTSYRYLDTAAKTTLHDLYIDYFFRRQDAHWKKEALKKLPALKQSTNMLICGEDLGLVPDCVPDVMKQLGILSLEIQRMPKGLGSEFFHPANAPYMAVVTPSTHDMSTIRGWWEEDREKTQRFFNTELGQWGEAPAFCEAWINKAILLQHLNSPAMWSIFQLQDILGMSAALRREDPHQERINIPANAKHYWRYRMHITLEQLLKEKAFNHEFRDAITASGRS